MEFVTHIRQHLRAVQRGWPWPSSGPITYSTLSNLPEIPSAHTLLIGVQGSTGTTLTIRALRTDITFTIHLTGPHVHPVVADVMIPLGAFKHTPLLLEKTTGPVDFVLATLPTPFQDTTYRCGAVRSSHGVARFAKPEDADHDDDDGGGGGGIIDFPSAPFEVPRPTPGSITLHTVRDLVDPHTHGHFLVGFRALEKPAVVTVDIHGVPSMTQRIDPAMGLVPALYGKTAIPLIALGLTQVRIDASEAIELIYGRTANPAEWVAAHWKLNDHCGMSLGVMTYSPSPRAIPLPGLAFFFPSGQ